MTTLERIARRADPAAWDAHGEEYRRVVLVPPIRTVLEEVIAHMKGHGQQEIQDILDSNEASAENA